MITGGAGGIGVVYAEALAEAGAAVVVADLDVEAATAAADALAAKGHAVTGTRSTCARPSRRRRWGQAAVDAFGGVDILINNAAIMVDLPPYGLANMPVDEWDRVMDVNLRGPLLCTQAVFRRWRRAAAAASSTDCPPVRSCPAASTGSSKFALHGLTVNLASELGGRGINVNAIAPGLVDNESGYVALPKDSPFRDAIAATIPGKPSGPPEDLVGTLLLLCSRAGDWITGQTILVDGGWITRL